MARDGRRYTGVKGMLLRWLRNPFAARYYRYRQRAAKRFGPMWEQRFGQCLYCYYTRWAKQEHGLELELEPHRCIEGNTPTALPTAIATSGHSSG
jgi:hypothetical protein